MTTELDVSVKVGSIVQARWIVGRDPYDPFEEGDLYLVHQSLPRFTARWRVGEPPPRPLVYVDAAGSGEHDRDDLGLYDFLWIDEHPTEADFRALMTAAVAAIDAWIAWEAA
jgi:hypothetical protein